METLDPEKWIDNYADYLYNYTIVRVNDHIIAQELVSETLLAAWHARKNFKGKASERTWLTSILKRKIIDHYRKVSSAKGKAEVSMSYPSPEMEGDWLEENIADLQDRTAEDILENEELRLAILNCLHQLPKRQAELFRMKTIEGIDTETICKEYHITPSNLWVIIHRARKSMMACLEKTWFN